MKNNPTNDEIWKEYALFLKKVMEEKGLSPSTLAPLVGVHRTTLSRFFRLESLVRAEHFFPLVDALGLEISFKRYDGKELDLSGINTVCNLTMETLIDDSIAILKNEDGELFIDLKSVCNTLGVSWPNQLGDLTDNKDLFDKSFAASYIDSKKDFHKTTVMPLMYAPGWILTIKPPPSPISLRKKVLDDRIQLYEKLMKLVLPGSFS